MNDVNYHNSVHLAAIIEGQLAQDRPNAIIVPTSNPGKDDEHYIGLVMRVYADGSNLNTFKGYVTFRYCEVKRKAKVLFLPVLSSIELRDEDFNPFPTPVKIHFEPNKVQTEDALAWTQALTEANASGIVDLRQKEEFFMSKLGEGRLNVAYEKILDLIDGTL